MCRVGPTGEFPDGKLDDSDKGELTLAVTAMPAENVVRIDFGTALSWLALPRAEVLQLAHILKEAALKLRGTE